MAHNNHFFFSGLAKSGGADKSEHMSQELMKELELSFGSLESLRRELVLTADAMFGPGFVWLVQHTDGVGGHARPFKILTTYQAGTPYPTAHWRNQGVDMNNHGGAGEGGAVVKEYFDRQNMANRREPLHGSGFASSPTGKSQISPPPGGTNVVPVLCVNTWEHVWMWDYGVAGKSDFVANWWNIIDWGRVQALSTTTKRPMTSSPVVGAGGPALGQEPQMNPGGVESNLGMPQ
jgi:superoxide dismutase, Fe-Mn family